MRAVDFLHRFEAVVLLMGAVLVLMAVARRILMPYPIFLVLGGLLLSVVPGVPAVRLGPELVFLIFLPPILWAAAYFTSLRDFQANLRPITLLAVGLVLATTAAVAAVAHAIMPGLGWPAAFVLGAIVSPPDAVAATAVARRLRIPHRVVTILEGESLVNDAAALVLYRAAVAATVTGTFAPRETVWQFVLAAAGGVAVGLAVGFLTRAALRHAEDSLVETAITLLAPYAAWILSERLHASAVLACVAGGVYVRQGFSTLVAPETRIRARAVWELLVFVLNGVIFVLIGLQLRAIRDAGLSVSSATIVIHAAVISAVAIGVRLLWVPLAAVVPRLLSPALRRRDPLPPWPAIFLLAWIGMRGVVSLAAALGLPLTTASGAPFPYRDEITGPHVRGDPGHPRAPGSEPHAPRPPAPARRRHQAGGGGSRRPRARGPGGAGAARRAGAGAAGARRGDRADAHALHAASPAGLVDRSRGRRRVCPRPGGPPPAPPRDALGGAAGARRAPGPGRDQ